MSNLPPMKIPSIPILNNVIKPKIRRIKSTYSLENMHDMIYDGNINSFHYQDWCDANNIPKEERNKPETLKKFKIDTILKAEDGGFKFKHDNIQDYIVDNLQDELIAEMDAETIKRCKKLLVDESSD